MLPDIAKLRVIKPPSFRSPRDVLQDPELQPNTVQGTYAPLELLAVAHLFPSLPPCPSPTGLQINRALDDIRDQITSADKNVKNSVPRSEERKIALHLRSVWVAEEKALMRQYGLEDGSKPSDSNSTRDQVIHASRFMDQYITPKKDICDDVSLARNRFEVHGDDTFPPSLRVRLLPYQLAGLNWMEGAEEARWGGILADEMGLGKTVEITALLVLKAGPRETPGGTLIVLPLAILPQWYDELDRLTPPGLFKIYKHHGQQRHQTPAKLAEEDIVLVTYETLAAEHKRAHNRRRPLFLLRWKRVILDEAHQIRNRDALASKAVSDLDAQYRWCLTGTLIINRLTDIYPLLRFLQVPVWSLWKNFHKYIGTLEKNDPLRAIRTVRNILSVWCLRRTKMTLCNGKPLLKLPKRTIATEPIEFPPEQAEIYYTFERSVAAKVDGYRHNNALGKNMTHVFTLLLRLRQLCAHPNLVDQATLNTALSTNRDEWDEFFAKHWVDADIINALGYLEEFGTACSYCPITCDIAARITPCGHLFCAECIADIKAPLPGQKRETYFDCPCNHPQGVSLAVPIDLLRPDLLEEEEEDIVDVDTLLKRSGKLKRMVELVVAWQGQYPDEKIIVISQWVTFLHMAIRCLESRHISCAQYHGDMTTEERNVTLAGFLQNIGGPPVLALSLKAGALGLNLTRANRVILLDLAWSPEIEHQAFDRVHRIGQDKEVKIVRFVITGTIEDRLLEIQRTKNILVQGSLGDGLKSEWGAYNAQDMANLLHPRENV